MNPLILVLESTLNRRIRLLFVCLFVFPLLRPVLWLAAGGPAAVSLLALVFNGDPFMAALCASQSQHQDHHVVGSSFGQEGKAP